MKSRELITDHSITEHVYAADGRRLKTIHRTSVPQSPSLGIGVTASLPSSLTQSIDSVDYVGNFIYEKGQLKRYMFDDGYLRLNTNNTCVPRFFIKDHLGNNRILTDGSGNIKQNTNYYPYGGMTSISTGQGEQQFKYNGKEYDPMHGLNEYDYGARQYDPARGQFTTMDPLCEKYYHISPYAYCGGNPVNRVDPDGKDIWTINQKGIVVNYEINNDKDIVYIGFEENGIYKKNMNKYIEFPYGTIHLTHGENYDEYCIEGDIYGTQLFEFLAENTDVEFGQLKIGKPITGLNYITTSFKDNNESGLSKIFNRLIRAVNKDCNFREWIHSHPGNSNWPSGFDKDSHEYKGTGDMAQVKSVTKSLSEGKWHIPVFKIYPKKDKKYVEYHSNSTRYDFK